MLSKVISHTDIHLSSDILLDSLVISIHISQFELSSAIVLLAFKINNYKQKLAGSNANPQKLEPIGFTSHPQKIRAV